MLTQWNTCHRNRTVYWAKIIKFWCRLSGFEAWPCHLLAVWPWVGYITSLFLHLSNVILIASSFLIRWWNYYAKLLSIMLKFDCLCMGLFLNSLFILLIYLYIFRPILSCLDYCSFILSLEIRSYECSFSKLFWLSFISEAIWAWCFLCRMVFNYKFSFSNRYWAIYVFKFFLILSILVICIFK